MPQSWNDAERFWQCHSPGKGLGGVGNVLVWSWEILEILWPWHGYGEILRVPWSYHGVLLVPILGLGHFGDAMVSVWDSEVLMVLQSS